MAKNNRAQIMSKICGSANLSGGIAGGITSGVEILAGAAKGGGTIGSGYLFKKS